MGVLKEVSEEISRILLELKRVFKVESLDALIAQSEVRTVAGQKLVVKRFSSEIGLLKWLPPAILLKASYPFALTPRERFERELNFMSFGKWEGFKVPRILDVDREDLVITREYVEGRPLSCDRAEGAALLGRVLAEVHSKGFCLGDVKPTNFVVRNGDVYVIDAEQSVEFREELGSWDISVAAFFISLASYMKVGEFGHLFDVFSREYLRSGGHRGSYCDVLSPRNAVLITFIPLPNLVVLSEVRRRHCH